MTRAEYGSGSVYRRASDNRWVGAIANGYNANGTRRRSTVTATTKAQVKRKLRGKRLAIERGEETSKRMTVAQWAKAYLDIRVRDLSPKGYNAAANPVRNWVVPAIGHRRLDALTPADVRAVHTACRAAGRDPADVHRAMRTMLNRAAEEGHHIPTSVLKVKAPKSGKSDRAAMTVAEGLACIKAAADLPHGVRWLFALLYGERLGECLGLTWDAIDFDKGEARIEWQLQSLPYVDRKNKAAGFRIPDGYELRHLVDGYHLVRPKSKAGYRVAPLLPPVQRALLAWREKAPHNPWGLVWPTAGGRPANDKHDRAEWHALQGTAGVGHPSGRPYHIHECRSFAATMLFDAGVPEHVITDLLGHSTIATSLRYRTVRREPLLDALTLVGERLELNKGGPT
jgi:integrase